MTNKSTGPRNDDWFNYHFSFIKKGKLNSVLVTRRVYAARNAIHSARPISPSFFICLLEEGEKHKNTKKKSTTPKCKNKISTTHVTIERHDVLTGEHKSKRADILSIDVWVVNDCAMAHEQGRSILQTTQTPKCTDIFSFSRCLVCE